jgi:hypothetical protein
MSHDELKRRIAEQREKEKMRDPTELLPCPFCGSEAFLYGLEGELIKCETCQGESPDEAWNRRANRWAAFETEELRALSVHSSYAVNGLATEIRTELARREGQKK